MAIKPYYMLQGRILLVREVPATIRGKRVTEKTYVDSNGDRAVVAVPKDSLGYNPEAVDKAIKRDKRIGTGEGKMVHRLLQGRSRGPRRRVRM